MFSTSPYLSVEFSNSFRPIESDHVAGFFLQVCPDWHVVRFPAVEGNFLRKTAWRTKYGEIHTYMVEADLIFQWDLLKDATNLKKHGRLFLEAIETFKDPKGLQLVDREHSLNEQRRYWVGKSSSGRELTTWLTMRGSKIRIIGCAEQRKFRSLYEAAKIE